MKIKTLVVTLLFAISMWAQNPAPTAPAIAGTQNQPSCCKKDASCCKDGASCCSHSSVAKADCCKAGASCCRAAAACCSPLAKDVQAKSCCDGNLCKRHKAEKA